MYTSVFSRSVGLGSATTLKTRGLTRSSRLMQQLLPLLLGWLSESPDPDLGLLGLRTLASGQHLSAQLVGTFRESPEAARRLCLLLGTSRLLSSALEHHPDLIPALGDDRRLLRASTRDDLGKAAATLRLRGLVRLLPPPCANTTTPTASATRPRSPSSIVPSACGIATVGSSDAIVATYPRRPADLPRTLSSASLGIVGERWAM